jgi:hypothetical protein
MADGMNRRPTPADSMNYRQTPMETTDVRLSQLPVEILAGELVELVDLVEKQQVNSNSFTYQL